MRCFVITLLLLCPLAMGCDAAMQYGEMAAEPVLEPVVDPVVNAISDSVKQQKQFAVTLHNWDEQPVTVRCRWVIQEKQRIEPLRYSEWSYIVVPGRTAESFGCTMALTFDELESRKMQLEIAADSTTLPLGTWNMKPRGVPPPSTAPQNADGTFAYRTTDTFKLPVAMTPEEPIPEFRVSGQSGVLDIHEDWDPANFIRT